MKYQHLFGPVASRRLGISLGLDLVPYKYCPLNCVYCEVQRTTHLSTERSEFFALADILAELDSFLKDSPQLDHITFSGAGEPTLYLRIGEIIRHIKTRYPQYKLALLTNSVLFPDPGIRRDCLPCDVVLPSLDAVSQDVYEKINRPRAGLRSSDLIEGLKQFRKEYSGKIWLEVFILPGVNDTEQEVYLLRDTIAELRPDIVQINSLDRPGAEDWVEAASPESLSRIRDIFAETLPMPVEIIAKAEYIKAEHPVDAVAGELIQSILVRRPCTAEDLASMLNLHINEISKILRRYSAEGLISSHRETRGVFYVWKS
ncbi:MAG TPA: radical SAM protein [Candidatus Cloacimonadota bacterium]|nr:radical SAM protein [Candidatus Cloacimonadota bacterium]